VRSAIEAVKEVPWEPETIEAALEKAVADSGVGKGKFYTPLRDILTGKKVALPIHYCFGLLPKEVALARLERAMRVTA
jgi:glutamyl/glutaminyl-tRNA synthetase